MSDLIEGPISNLKAGVDYPTVQQLKKRIAELELINQNYRLGGQHKQDDWLELIDKCERLDAALAEIEGLGEGYTDCDEAVEIARKARRSDTYTTSGIGGEIIKHD